MITQQEGELLIKLLRRGKVKHGALATGDHYGRLVQTTYLEQGDFTIAVVRVFPKHSNLSQFYLGSAKRCRGYTCQCCGPVLGRDDLDPTIGRQVALSKAFKAEPLVL